jgi:hypothetical protein
LSVFSAATEQRPERSSVFFRQNAIHYEIGCRVYRYQKVKYVAQSCKETVRYRSVLPAIGADYRGGCAPWPSLSARRSCYRSGRKRSAFGRLKIETPRQLTSRLCGFRWTSKRFPVIKTEINSVSRQYGSGAGRGGSTSTVNFETS